MNSITLLREQLVSAENVINSVTWNKATPLMKSFRHWTIEALQFIQLKNFDKS